MERAKAGRASRAMLRRLELVAQGEVWDRARDARIALYEARAAAGVSVFTGEPPPPEGEGEGEAG